MKRKPLILIISFIIVCLGTSCIIVSTKPLTKTCSEIVNFPLTGVKVMVVGTYHFANPGMDLNTIEADDVLMPHRQKEIQAVVDKLATFNPTKIAVEVETDNEQSRNLSYYHDYLQGIGTDRHNEIVQIGFRLAAKLNHKEVLGIDTIGEFPYDKVVDFAKSKNCMDKIEVLAKKSEEETKNFEKIQSQLSIGQLLKKFNEPNEINKMHSWYMNMLYFGVGKSQPGSDLVAHWLNRNIGICARLAQNIESNDRVLVLYGAGHSHLLRRCVQEMPGWELVEANSYLPN